MGSWPVPTIKPLGDSALLVQFGTQLSDEANAAAIALADRLERACIAGVVEIAPNLISVLIRFDPFVATPAAIAGEVRLVVAVLSLGIEAQATWTVPVRFEGPDLAEVAVLLGLGAEAFVERHNGGALRVLATGFAPGFVYCGLHAGDLIVPRRHKVRPVVPAGSVLFAAGQTAIAATDMPTGWHVIGTTDLRNFDAGREPPTLMRPGDMVRFEVAP